MFVVVVVFLQKNEYFCGYEDFVNIFVSSQNWIFLVIYINFRVFPFKRSMHQIGFFLGGGGAKISNIFWGMPDKSDFFC